MDIDAVSECILTSLVISQVFFVDGPASSKLPGSPRCSSSYSTWAWCIADSSSTTGGDNS